jgi:arsenate reductase (thioredoxin)
MSERAYNVLFLCTGNSARSIMAECIMNSEGSGRFKAFSAGSFPAGRVHPYTLETLQHMYLRVDGLRSKSWDEFAQPDAPAMDFVLTVCDQAAGEVCPVWPGHPISAHWGVEDPVAITESEDAKRKAFHDAFLILKRRIDLFLSLPHATLDRMALHHEVQQLGKQ